MIDEKGGTEDINSLANTFGQLLLAENGSESDTATTMFAALDSGSPYLLYLLHCMLYCCFITRTTYTQLRSDILFFFINYADGDGHLSMEEMKDVLLNFFLDLKQRDIEKVAREIRDILLQHLTHKEGGLIALASQ